MNRRKHTAATCLLALVLCHAACAPGRTDISATNKEHTGP